MLTEGKLLIGKGENPAYLLPAMANRHGLITGATGTGKTITLKVITESFSDAGVPVFVADVKGDLAGACLSGAENEKIKERLAALGITDFPYHAYPTRFFDMYGECGHPVRTTISEMGPLLLSRLLDLSEVQQGVLNLAFRVADDNGLLLIDMKDLRAMLAYMGKQGKEFTTQYGNASRQSIGAIQRQLLMLEDAGGGGFFGEPALDINDWMQTDENGRGYINIFHCAKLFHSPMMYSTFMLWMLSELFERLPEEGDLEKPKLVFCFDEAHLLFSDAPKSLLQKVEQVVKLIRSKGVGVFFITQNPLDLPEPVLAQLGNRVQHALRAYTPNEQKAVRAAANSFRANPAFDTAEAITQLATGEALISFLDEDGVPGIVERATILPPMSRMGAIDEEVRGTLIGEDSLYEKYLTPMDGISAYEILNGDESRPAGDENGEDEAPVEGEDEAPRLPELSDEERQAMDPYQRIKYEKALAAQKSQADKKQESETGKGKKKKQTKGDKALGRVANSAMNSIGRELGRSLSRGLLGLLKN